MTRREKMDNDAAQRIAIISAGYDVEREHEEADAILCEILKSLGFTKTVTAFKKMKKWYA